MTKIIYEIRENTYYDSVTLMLISKEVKRIQGVYEVLVGMGTDLNKELAQNLNIITDEIKSIGANDFFITALVDEGIEIEKVVKEVDKLLSQRKKDSGLEYMPPTLSSALEQEPESNLVLISVAGEYAADEARKALNNDLHIMIFSDNVSLKEEKELKQLAVEKGLLMMGPDCGTAIINNIPLAFANVVNKGSIGIIGASGTGIQEITVLIDRLGGGVSQVIGTGGRDLHKEIGGLMMLQGIEALMKDPCTEVLVLVSKPPSEEIAEIILEAIENSNKPVVINFIGGDKEKIGRYGGYAGISLEDTARKAVALMKGEEVKDFDGFSLSTEEIDRIIAQEVEKLNKDQKYLRGLYKGGTLAEEAMNILSKELGSIYSNISILPEYRLEDIYKSIEHTCIDFGEDEFTVGKPHPMIDPSSRIEGLMREAEDEKLAVVLMDFVLGYGAHEDPIGEMIPAIEKARNKMKQKDKYLCIVSSICGTEKDPQNLVESQRRLEEAGVIVMPSNAQAARLVSLILKKNQ
ncbi:acyl-CoA synthetase FdrA [Clostridium sp. Cult2]|uniref:acyl-CoA synthetase FdrA n=1 Tax=Clostridium sp. Cult2 TaxID=2079003 RepID=UPI001F02D2A7|nr:acyl-CoA synthetase FdrA [Clostridium sp. Cult2]MCF6465450.1 FdrA family protein [Clostridium sp. Cult2]